MARRPFRRARPAAVVVLVTLVGLVVAPSSGAGVADTGPIVRTSDGRLAGIPAGDITEFLGIPYAAPPVGALRWRPPRPAADWSGVRQATTVAPHCAQLAGPLASASMSEDCLYLNVFTPARYRGGRPVMVWVHGGGLMSGASDQYDPTALVRRGVIVVTINYRLGALGFLAHPALAAQPGGPSGDYGLMDQQAALRWVQRDIGAFGGDAHDVTLFGQSAGGLSVLSQLASPGARGLFARAIVESGAYSPVQASLATADATGEQFAAGAGCADQTAACLRNLSVSTILASEDSRGYPPDIDGQVLVAPLSSAFATGGFNHVPVIDGTNHDENRQIVASLEQSGVRIGPTIYQSFIAGMLGVVFGVPQSAAITDADAIVAQYPLSDFPSAALALSALGTDADYSCTALTVDDSIARFVPTYVYEFNDEQAPPPPSPPVSFPYGAEHSAELQYLFNLPGKLSPAQLLLADTMQRYWTDFAKQGYPSPSWPSFNRTGLVQSLVPPGPKPETDFATAHHCAFWHSLLG